MIAFTYSEGPLIFQHITNIINKYSQVNIVKYADWLLWAYNCSLEVLINRWRFWTICNYYLYSHLSKSTYQCYEDSWEVIPVLCERKKWLLGLNWIVVLFNEGTRIQLRLPFWRNRKKIQPLLIPSLYSLLTATLENLPSRLLIKPEGCRAKIPNLQFKQSSAESYPPILISC